MKWYEYLVTIGIPVSGIVATAWVAIYTIRKTSEENRVTNIYVELCSCLVDTIVVIDEVLALLGDIARRVVYMNVAEQKITESAYDRYWRKIGNLSTSFKKIHAKQKLVFPKNLYSKTQDILKKINAARELVRNANPEDKPDTTELQKVVDEIRKLYEDFLNNSREYLGTDKIGTICMSSESILKSEYEA